MSDVQADFGALTIQRTAPAGAVDVGGQGTLTISPVAGADALRLMLAGVPVTRVDQNGKISVNAPTGYLGSLLQLQLNGVNSASVSQNGQLTLGSAGTDGYVIVGQNNLILQFPNGKSAFFNVNGVGNVFSVDSKGHLLSLFSGTPGVLTSLGANVTSGTPSGNDIAGSITIVVSGAVAAGAVIGTFGFVNAYPASSPKSVQFTIASSSNPTFGPIGYTSLGTGSFVVINGSVAMSAGTYVFGYAVIG